MRAQSSDAVAIAGVYSAPYARDRQMTLRSMVLEACAGAIRDAGLTAADIDGICGSQSIAANQIQAGLRIPSVTWHCNTRVVFHHQLIEAVNAIVSGACSAVLCYHGTFRSSGTSRSAAQDPFRVRFGPGTNVPNPNPDAGNLAVAYAAWADRYLHQAGEDRTVFGRIAVNSRSHAAANEHSAMRSPLTIDDYLAAPILRSPFSSLDMDLPVDGADAFVITSTERARDLAKPPVLIHAAVMGMTAGSLEEHMPSFEESGQVLAARELMRRSDLAPIDADLFYAYDGFTVTAARWFEAIGYCEPYRAATFIESHWNEAAQRIEIDGRVLVNTHGGSLSDGGTQGVGHVREAALQLRGDGGARQVPDARVALVTIGGFFYNAAAALLRSDG